MEIAEGVELEDGQIAADAISYMITKTNRKSALKFIQEETGLSGVFLNILGYRVKKLDRVYFAGLTKKNLPRGK